MQIELIGETGGEVIIFIVRAGMEGIDRADQIIHLCEAKFTKENYAINKDYSEQLRLKKTIFKQVTQTKKAVFTTLITTYPALKNKYFLLI